MTDVTNILGQIGSGDSSAAEKLLPLVYEELRRLAAQRLQQEKPGQTLQATALVHEAYVRLVDNERAQRWDSRGHFFAAAAEAMRRILVDQARRKNAERHGGGLQRHDVDHVETSSPEAEFDVIAIHEALEKFEQVDPVKAKLVKLRYFTGITIPQAAEAMGISSATADRYWAYARAWLHSELN